MTLRNSAWTKKFIDEANHTLREYDSWKIYCDRFEDGRERNQKEGNFFLAKLYQNNAAKVESKEVSESIISSPANHTRSRAQRRALIEELDQSPTKLKADANASKSLPTGSNGVKKPLALRLKGAREPPNGPDELPKTRPPRTLPSLINGGHQILQLGYRMRHSQSLLTSKFSTQRLSFF